MEPLNWKQGPDPGDQTTLNERIFLAIALAAALAVFFASHMPRPLFAPVLGELLFWSALGSAFAAHLHGQSIFSNRLTYWDQALILLWLGMLAGFFTDMEAAQEALDQLTGNISGGTFEAHVER